MAAYGITSGAAISITRSGSINNVLSSIIGDFSGMPDIMKKLALAQFFSLLALFIIWIYTTPVVTQYSFGSADPSSAAYGEDANWVGR